MWCRVACFWPQLLFGFLVNGVTLPPPFASHFGVMPSHPTVLLKLKKLKFRRTCRSVVHVVRASFASHFGCMPNSHHTFRLKGKKLKFMCTSCVICVKRASFASLILVSCALVVLFVLSEPHLHLTFWCHAFSFNFSFEGRDVQIRVCACH